MLDLSLLEGNIDRMAAFASARGLHLRPHAKTHKSRAVAALQAKAGAVGICCATLHEAECLAGAAPSILLTSPVAGPVSAARISALAARGVDLAVVADHSDILAQLDAALPVGARIRVFVDVDPGMGRTGVTSPQDAVCLARQITRHAKLIYGGIQFYCGGEQHILALDVRRAAIASRNVLLRQTIAALTAAGLSPPVVTGGGTGTHGIDADAGLLTELQPGSYIFMDQDYGACDVDGAGPFEVALTVHATVISANRSGWVTIDAGIKSFAADSGTPVVVAGAPLGSIYHFAGDEFGRLDIPIGSLAPSLGTRVILATSHCDPTVNLNTGYHLARGGTPAGVWPVDARGHG